MTQTIIDVQHHPEPISHTKNWLKISQALQIHRQVVTSVTQLFTAINSDAHINHVWMDIECVQPPQIINVGRLVDCVRMVCEYNNRCVPPLVLRVSEHCDLNLLRSVLDQDVLGVVVHSDLKLKRIMLEAVSNFLMRTPHSSTSVVKLLTDQPALFRKVDDRKTHFTYLIPSTPRMIAQQTMLGFCEHMRITMDRCESWMQLISKLQMTNYSTDVVIVDLAVITGVHGSSLMDMINCVHTVRRSVTHKNNFRLYVAVAAHADLNVIRQVLKTPGVHGLCPILTQGFDQNDLQLAVTHMCLYQNHIPDQIQQRLKQRKHTSHKKSSSAKLTPRQAEIFELITKHAASNKVIAHRLKISEGAVKTHVGNLLRKFGLRSRTELAVYNPG